MFEQEHESPSIDQVTRATIAFLRLQDSPVTDEATVESREDVREVLNQLTTHCDGQRKAFIDFFLKDKHNPTAKERTEAEERAEREILALMSVVSDKKITDPDKMIVQVFIALQKDKKAFNERLDALKIAGAHQVVERKEHNEVASEDEEKAQQWEAAFQYITRRLNYHPLAFDDRPEDG